MKSNRLLASIKMPIVLVVGNSSRSDLYLCFSSGRSTRNDYTVKFIDFTNDGYTRSNRKKSSNNLRDTDHAKEKYQEVVDLVKYGKSKLHYLTESEYYEGNIDVSKGDDWNQTAPIDLKPTLNDFKKTISNYLAWEVSNLLQNQSTEDEMLGK